MTSFQVQDTYLRGGNVMNVAQPMRNGFSLKIAGKTGGWNAF